MTQHLHTFRFYNVDPEPIATASDMVATIRRHLKHLTDLLRGGMPELSGQLFVGDENGLWVSPVDATMTSQSSRDQFLNSTLRAFVNDRKPTVLGMFSVAFVTQPTPQSVSNLIRQRQRSAIRKGDLSECLGLLIVTNGPDIETYISDLHPATPSIRPEPMEGAYVNGLRSAMGEVMF